MSVRALLFAVPLGIAASGCILLVSLQDAGGPHCQFAGVGTACGACLEKQCAAAVDSCCMGDQCGGVIDDVEACASGGSADACGRLVDPADRGGAHDLLSRCATSCSDVCPVPAKVFSTHCERAYVTSVDSCRCDVGQAANDTPCTEEGHPDLRCCAPQGWPAPVLACECDRIICVAAGAGCLCELSPMDDQDRPTSCTGAVCCADPTGGTCSCGSTACMPGEQQVASCTIDALACTDGKHRVQACTLPK